MVYGAGALDSFILRRLVILKGFGYSLTVWILLVSNVGAVEPSEMDSVLVDIIKGNYYGAMVRCEDVIAADSTAADAYRFLGWLQIVTRQGDLQDAGENLRRAIHLEIEDAGIHNDLGFVYFFQRNYSLAIEAFEQAIALKLDETLFYRNLGFVSELAGVYSDSESAFKAVLERDPTDDLAVYGYGLALVRQARYDEALMAFQKAVRMFSDRKEAHLEIGQLMMMHGDYASAVSAYKRATKIDFEDPKGHYGLAQAYQVSGDSLSARHAWETFKFFDKRHRHAVRDQYVLPVRFDKIADLLDFGDRFVRLGQQEKAIEVYREGVALVEDPDLPWRFSPEVPVVYLALGQSYQALGEVERARHAYDAAFALGEGGMVSDEALRHRTDMFLCADGLSRDVVKRYERIVAMDPIAYAAFYIYDQISQAQAKTGHLNKCISTYQIKVDQVAYSAGLLMRLGVAHAVAGEMDAAKALYDQVIEGVKDPRELYLQLSILYGRAGRQAEAEAMAAKARDK